MVNQKRVTNDPQVVESMQCYYTTYYRDDLGLPDWRIRVANRLNEEQVFASPAINWIETWLNFRFTGKRVLVVGAGTGAEIFVL